MRAVAGENFRDWIGDAGVVGLWEVLKHYRFFREEFGRTLAEIETAQPDAVVLIDYPGFNLRLARALRERTPRLKIIYYISPQVWAWNRRRISQMARWLDLMLCIFPFEPDLYQASGLRSVFVGHPLVPSTPSLSDLEADRDDSLIALFPGSREREVRKIFPVMRDAAQRLFQQHSGLRFEVGAASEKLAQFVRDQLPPPSPLFSVSVGQASSLMRRARAGMVASGTATLEAALARLPFVLIYRVNWFTYFAARLVVKVDHLGMPNVLAGREIIPEFIQHRARAGEIANAVASLIPDGERRRRMLLDFDEVASRLGSGDAAANAAKIILAQLRPA